MKEATARIKINKLLETAGWRFFADANGPANIQLELSVSVATRDLDALGENFEKASKGFIDFLQLNEKGFPFIVLQAKAEDKNPLVGKEQARKYAKSQNCRFVILSNGNLHYFWDLERGNPYVITAFPTPASVTGYQKSVPDPNRLIAETVADDYVVLTQRPGYAPIPLPPLATQQAIVAEIEAEQALVAANRELITRFERKIQATLARIWGEAESS
jgi:type I restriction enzyme R subunit